MAGRLMAERQRKKGVHRDPTRGCNAIEGFVENESDRPSDEALVLKWEDGCRDPVKEAEYLIVVEMCLQIRGLSTVSREDLLRDARAEPRAKS